MARKKQPQQSQQERPKLKKIGALWITRKNGKTFMSGRIDLDEQNEMRILVFKNDYKEEEKHPDYQVFEIPEENQIEQAQKNFMEDDDIPY